MNTDTLALLLILYNVSHYIWKIKWMKNVISFQIGKIQPQGFA